MQNVVIDGAKVPNYDVHAHCESVVHGPVDGGVHVRIAGSDSVVLTDEQFHAALVWPTAAQWDAIQEQVARYDDEDVPADGLDGYTIESAASWDYERGGRWAGKASYPEGAAAVQYRYRYSDDRKGSGMTGLEVTVFDRDGKVIDSQDFG